MPLKPTRAATRHVGWRIRVFSLFCFSLAAAGVFPAPLSAAEEAEETGPGEPESLTVRSDDGLQLATTYYPGNKDKDTVPVIILHDLQETGSDYEELALFLQSQGHSVVVPDLRGHGGSTSLPDTGKKAVTLRPESLKYADLEKIIRLDLEVIKFQILRPRNNSEELNIDKLCVIGTGLGSVLALNWAWYDWSHKDLPNFRQGKDVKALVLITPQLSVKKLTIQNALLHRDVRSTLSILLMVGANDQRNAKIAKRIHTKLKRSHPDPPPNKEKELQKLFYVRHDTTLQGAKLLGRPEFQAKKNDRRIHRLEVSEPEDSLAVSSSIPSRVMIGLASVPNLPSPVSSSSTSRKNAIR